jgi:hypothetical protein
MVASLSLLQLARLIKSRPPENPRFSKIQTPKSLRKKWEKD